MDPDLEALKRQRDLVAQHLAWLEAEVERRSSGAFPKEPTLLSTNHGVTDARNPISIPAAEGAPDAIPTPHRGLARGQQLGCVALAVAVAALAIFVFWILPNWIYD